MSVGEQVSRGRRSFDVLPVRASGERSSAAVLRELGFNMPVGGIPFNRFLQDFVKKPVVQLNAADKFVSMIDPKIYLQHGICEVLCDNLATSGRWYTNVSLLAGDLLVLSPDQYVQHMHIMIGSACDVVYVHAAVATDVRVYGPVTVPVEQIREHLGPGVAWSSTMTNHFRHTATKLQLRMQRVGNLQMLPYGAQFWFAQEAHAIVSGGTAITGFEQLKVERDQVTDPLDDWTPVYESRYSVAPLVAAGQVYAARRYPGVFRLNSPRVESDQHLWRVNGVVRFLEHDADVAVCGPGVVHVDSPGQDQLQRGVSVRIVVPENDYAFDCHYGDDD